MIVSEIVLLVIWQIVPVVPAACFSQPVLPLDVEQEDEGAKDT